MKEGVARVEGEVSSVLQSFVEQLLCTEVSNVHLMDERGDRTPALVVVQVSGLIKARLRLYLFVFKAKHGVESMDGSKILSPRNSQRV